MRNQPSLYDGIDAFFAIHLGYDADGESVRRHVEHETALELDVNRFSFVCRAPEDIPDAKRWRNLKAIGVVAAISQRTGKD